MKAAIKRPIEPLTRYVPPVGGALSPTDPYYIERREDLDLQAAIERHEAFVLLRGARQMGKTSMAARALNNGRSANSKSVFMDFQKMNEAELRDIETFYKSIIQWLCDELGLDVNVDEFWSARRPPNSNLERFVLQKALPAAGAHLVWAMDEVDRLLVNNSFASEFFGLLRTWHNNRSSKPQEEWERLTILIAYATEPHLFITSLDQSPFNVGLKLNLRDFLLEEVQRLHDKYSAGLTAPQIGALYDLLGGQPYLTSRGLAEVARGRVFDDVIARADREDGPFGDHLRRILVVLARNPELKDAVRLSFCKKKVTLEELYRLRRAGIFIGETPEEARPRCKLYESYLRRHLPTA